MLVVSKSIFKSLRGFNTLTSTTTIWRRGPASNNKIQKALFSGGDPAWMLPLPPTGTMTKVVCTLGPSTDSQESINALVSSGMNVARINCSHMGSDYNYPVQLIESIRNAPGRHSDLSTSSTGSSPLPKNVRAVLIDTKGPEIRTLPLQNDEDVVDIAKGATVEITTVDVSSDPLPSSPEGPHRIQVDYPTIANVLSIGGQILLDDGLIALEITSIDTSTQSVMCKALNGGPIKKNKGVNLPNTSIDLPALTEKDKLDLKWACQIGADYIAASFIRSGSNARSVVAYLDRCVDELRQEQGQEMEYKRPLVISKIENKEGLDNFHEILKESDGIMVARGDLGVEIPYRKVFAAQKMMVTACNEAGKPVIVATQMLDSMQRNPRPTRAEVTDVGTAVLDGADAVMLSGETAAGAYPIESIKAMVSVVAEADTIVPLKKDVGPTHNDKGVKEKGMTYLEEELYAMAESAVESARDMKVKVIILITTTGTMAKAVAKQKPTVPILAFCTDSQVARQLQLYRSVVPLLLQSKLDPNDEHTRMGLLRAEAVRTAKELGFVRAGDRIVFADRSRGKVHDTFEYSHNIKLSTLKDS